jgi:hypothetical protein
MTDCPTKAHYQRLERYDHWRRDKAKRLMEEHKEPKCNKLYRRYTLNGLVEYLGCYGLGKYLAELKSDLMSNHKAILEVQEILDNCPVCKGN